nr:uncharacterized protein LOC105344867 isoform X2 [Crassostrea gigas]
MEAVIVEIQNATLMIIVVIIPVKTDKRITVHMEAVIVEFQTLCAKPIQIVSIIVVMLVKHHTVFLVAASVKQQLQQKQQLPPHLKTQQ